MNRSVSGLHNRYLLSRGLSGAAYEAKRKESRDFKQPVGIAYAEGKDENGAPAWVMGINVEGFSRPEKGEHRAIIGPVGKRELLCYSPESTSPLDAPRWYQYGPLVTATFCYFPVRSGAVENPHIRVTSRGREVELASEGVYGGHTVYGIIANPNGKNTTYEVEMAADICVADPAKLEELRATLGDEALIVGNALKFDQTWRFRTGKDKV